MATTAREAYAETVRDLSPGERLRLAALILQELTKSDPLEIPYQQSWSEEDQSDLTAFSLQYAAALYPEEEDLIGSR